MRYEAMDPATEMAELRAALLRAQAALRDKQASA